jgi:hypothetical protein
LFLFEFERLRRQCVGNPIGKWGFSGNVLARGSVYLMNLCKIGDWESIRDSHQSRPQSPMHVSYLSADEPAHEDIRTIPDRAGHRKDLSTLRVCPPATVNRLAGDSFGERRNRACAGFQHDSLCLHEGQGFGGCHESAISQAVGAKQNTALRSRCRRRGAHLAVYRINCLQFLHMGDRTGMNRVV